MTKKHPLPCNQALLDVLVCPVSRESLRFDDITNELICDASMLAYPVLDGIPVLLAEKARKIKTTSDST